MMKHKIDPTVDCVFKAVLGKEENKNLLIHFLNAVLALDEGTRIQDVIILNPYNEREFENDKLTMNVLQDFSENEKNFLLYQKRLDAERVEATWKTMIEQERARNLQLQVEVEETKKREEQERREKEQEQREKEQERREKERLLALLKKAGIDPNQSE